MTLSELKSLGEQPEKCAGQIWWRPQDDGIGRPGRLCVLIHHHGLAGADPLWQVVLWLKNGDRLYGADEYQIRQSQMEHEGWEYRGSIDG